MRKKELKETVTKKCKLLHKLTKKIVADFGMQDIHKFRVQVKKIRAFVRLLQLQKRQSNSLNVTPKLKAFYKYVGIIRNIQLMQESVTGFCQARHISLPGRYIEYLQIEEVYWRKQVFSLTENNNFLDDVEIIGKRLPGKLNKSTISTFIKISLKTAKENIPGIEKDAAIHRIRKLLKDLLYNWEWVKRFNKRFPKTLSAKKHLKTLTNLLGSFRDKCIAINHVSDYATSNFVKPAEQRILNKMKMAWTKNRDKLNQEVSSVLRAAF